MAFNQKSLKYFGLILGMALIIAAHVYQLSFPDEPYYDEVHYTKFFKTLLHEHKYDYVSSHPPLWHLLTWGMIGVVGERPLAGRIVSLIAGMILMIGVYLLAKKVFQDKRTAILAVAFLFFDCISLTQARIGMLNSLNLMWMIFALWFFLKYVWDQEWPRQKTLLVTGVLLGLAVGTKLAAFGMFMMIYLWMLFIFIRKAELRRPLLLEGALFLVIVPVIIFTLLNCYLLFLPGYTFKDVWGIQVFNWHYHTVEAAHQTHGYMSQWWGWPLLLRPIWFHYVSLDEMMRGIICIGNPAMFWMIPGMLIFLIWDVLRQRNRISGFLLFGFLSQWLFYFLGGRLKFFHYIYYAMPFLALGLAWMCRRLWDQGKVSRWLVAVYIFMVIAMFIYWYPLLTGIQISDKFFRNHMWFNSWI